MQQKWWLIAAGVVGIGMAIVLFPRPDTGEDIPEADLTNADPLNFKEPGQEKAKASKTLPGGAKRRATMRRDLNVQDLSKRGPLPLAHAASRRKAAPEAVFAGRASGPWTIIRRQLILTETEAGKEMADEIAPLVSDLRSIRRDPMSLDWDEIVADQLALADDVRGNEAWMADETTVRSMERLDLIFQEIADDEAGD